MIVDSIEYARETEADSRRLQMGSRTQLPSQPMPTRTNWKLVRSRFLFPILILFTTVPILCAQTNLKSGDSYVRREGNEWIMGTA